jgi:hypothetical protein
MSGLIFYMHDGPSTFRFELSGSLAGGDVAKLEQAWRTASSTLDGKTLAVDLTFVSSADERGRELLMRGWLAGAHFVANSAGSRELVESITGSPYKVADAVLGPTFDPRFVAASLRAALVALSLTVTLLFPPTASAAEEASRESNAVLERYGAGLSEKNGLDRLPASVEIEASVPRLDKQAHVEAIRRWTEGRRKYQFVSVEGDSFVRNEMIARYFAIDTEAAPMAAPITKSNYKFRFVAMEGDSYVYQITPRKKRQGMIQGELWIDRETGLVTHLAGRLVKNPSIILRHVDIRQEMEIRGGAVYARETHLNMDTRFTGRAELTIRERTYRDSMAVAEVAEDVTP